MHCKLNFRNTISMVDASKNRITKRMGRPKGDAPPMVIVAIRLPADLVAAIDAWVAPTGHNRSEAIRRWIDSGLDHKPPKGWAKRR